MGARAAGLKAPATLLVVPRVEGTVVDTERAGMGGYAGCIGISMEATSADKLQRGSFCGGHAYARSRGSGVVE